MQLHVRSTTVGRVKDDALVVFRYQDQKVATGLKSLPGAVESIETLVEKKAFGGDAGQVQLITLPSGGDVAYLVLVGLGDRSGDIHAALRTGAAQAARTARDAGAVSASFLLPDAPKGRSRKEAELAHVLAEGALVGLYRFESYLAKPSEKKLETLTLLTGGADRDKTEKGARLGEAVANGICRARDLGNHPGNVCTPTWLADQAREIADAHDGLSLTVMDQEQMEKHGMGSLLGVSKGSSEPPKLIVLRWEPKGKAARKKPLVALVGKGITFDTGGISLKPGAKMEDMKFDMCGGAAVIGTMQTVAELELGRPVVGVVPAVENMPDGAAYKPGDILTAMNGTTIEVRNTDAEGRLILADALAWTTTKMRPRPKQVIDLATLTGACIVALGNHHAALISTDESMAKELGEAGARSGDPLWRLPITDAYRDQLKSPYADVSNLGSPGAGTITAGCFLEKFVERGDWAHLDIAGMAWTSRTDGLFTTGATGFGVRVLTEYLRSS